ncbi:Ig-like domain repeat protein [Streptomyces sp. NPDC059474]|uniref:Ig-like domain repeat protein n=1 Tax=Streptomyces sp. NPDC059474 TaxID=3346846 RepID=UPI0036B52BF7
MASPTITLVTVTPNPSAVGQSVTLTATVIPLGVGTPTGTVTFAITGGPTLMGTLVGGTTSVTATGLSVGTHVVAALYSGDTNFLTSTGTSAIVVVPASTTTSVMSSPNPSALGQPVTFTATITPVAPGAGTPGGTAIFVISGSGGGTFVRPVVGGVATLSLSGLGGGLHAITAIYNGDTNFLPSSGSGTHTVNPGSAATTTTVVSAPDPSVFGQPVTFTATVTANPPATGTPTGTVTFTVTGPGGTVTGSGTLSGGAATFTTSALDANDTAYTVTAVYNPDTATFLTSTGTDTHTVNRADTKITITSIPNPSTVGETVSYIAFVEAVPPGAGVPTGNVVTEINVMDQTVFFTSVALDSNGFTLFTDNAFPAGAYTVSGQYEGDTNFNQSPIDTDPHIINP